MTRRPVIGIAGQRYVVRKFFGDLPVQGNPTRYVDHVSAAGGRPVILPMESAVDLLDVVDGLVLAGGGDLDPTLYGESSAHAVDVDRDRDRTEINLARRARGAGMPLLGVCRGAQVLAVAFGGTLRPHLGDDRPHVVIDGGHAIRTLAGSAVSALLGEQATVNSLHHQAVADPGPSWHPTAWADDGVIEAIEWGGHGSPWAALGVQWHPELERVEGQELFAWLVRESISRSR